MPTLEANQDEQEDDGRLLHAYWAATDANQAADHAVHVLLHRLSQTLDANRRKARATARATHATLDALNQLVFLHHMQPDPGEPNHTADPRWLPERPPERPVVDAWSRGAVQRKPRQPEGPPHTSGRSSPAPSSVRSVSSRRLLSRASSPTQRNALADPSKGQTVVAKSKGLPPQRERAHPAALAPVPVAVVDKVRATGNASAIERDAKIQALRRREKEMRSEEIKASLKGREYTVDPSGRAIVINPVGVERLPALRMYPGVKMQSGIDRADDKKAKPDSGRRGRSGRGGQGTQPPSTDRVAFIPIQTGQPPLSENIELKPGVVLREEGATIKGSARKPAAGV